MAGITTDTRNYRVHNTTNKELIRKSLTECGAGRSILLDSKSIVIAGKEVFEQARAMGLKIRIVESDGSELIAVKRSDLATNDEKRKLLALADNRTSDTSTFDIGLLLEDFGIEGLNVWEFDLPFDDIPRNVDDFFMDAENTEKKRKTVTCPCCGHIFEI